MTEVYHSTVSTSDTTKPVLDRLWDWLEQRWRASEGKAFRTSHRRIAEAIDCSASRLPALMRQLEEWGWIVREKTDKFCYVRLIDQSRHAPRAAVDRSIDRSIQTGQNEPVDRSVDRSTPPMTNNEKTMVQPATTPKTLEYEQVDRSAAHVGIMTHDSAAAAACAGASLSDTQQTLKQALEQAGASEQIAQRVVQACPDRTPAELQRALAFNARRHEQGRADTPTGLVFSLWAKGERLAEEEAALQPRQEPRHAPANRPQPKSTPDVTRAGDTVPAPQPRAQVRAFTLSL